ncbi:MAG: efflux RND transporter periplasmic adaptor subunit [Bacteroidales bacterium]
MKNKILIFLTAGTLLFTACNNSQVNDSNDIATVVRVQELVKGDISQFVNSYGSAQPTQSVNIISEISGKYILAVNPETSKKFKLGDKVKKGDKIIQLVSSEYENQIAIDAKKLDYQLAKQKREKMKSLYEKGGVTLNEMRQADVSVTNAKYAYANAQLSIEKMSIKAPFDGYITDLPYYTENVQIATGLLLVQIMNYSKLYLDCQLPESVITEVKRGQKVNITHYTLNKDTLIGHITEMSPAINIKTRTFKTKVIIDNISLRFKPGMFVKADIMIQTVNDAIIIPKDVIIKHHNSKYVYITQKNVAKRKKIFTGVETEDECEIVSGLELGDNLIVGGFETLKDNSKVKIRR